MGSHNQDQNLRCRWRTVLTELDAKWIPIPLPRAPTEVPLFLFIIICFHLMFNQADYPRKLDQSPDCGLKFLDLIKRHPFILPFSDDAMSIFMFVDQDYFLHTWYTWFLPTLQQFPKTLNWVSCIPLIKINNPSFQLLIRTLIIWTHILYTSGFARAVQTTASLKTMSYHPHFAWFLLKLTTLCNLQRASKRNSIAHSTSTLMRHQTLHLSLICLYMPLNPVQGVKICHLKNIVIEFSLLIAWLMLLSMRMQF